MAKFSEMNLRARLALSVVLTISLVVFVMSAISVVSLQRNLDSAMASKSEAMRGALVRKGVAIGRNVALSSSRALLTGNFVFLVDVINSTVANDGEVVYGILMDKNRHALVHSVPELASAAMDAPEDLFAAQQTEVATQNSTFRGEPVLEVIAPFSVANQPWGAVRFGMSLKTVHNEIAQSEATAREQIFLAILVSVGAAMVLLMMGSYFGVASASSLIKPLQKLSAAADRIRKGDLSHALEPEGSQEFRHLALGFNAMSEAVAQREYAMQTALEQAQEANRLKGEFLANVSHELRTPLNAIINVPAALVQDYETQLAWHCESCDADFNPPSDTQLTTEDAHAPCPKCGSSMSLRTIAFYHGDPSEHYHFLRRTLQSAQHLLAVVTDILDFSKLEAGKMTLTLTNVNIRSSFEEVRDTISVLAGAKAITINWPDLPPTRAVWADSVKLSQILLNLLSNAVKFSPKSSQIDILCSEDMQTQMTTFSVRDHGMGIPADKLGELFQSFRQVDGSHTRAHGGTGLGLAICRKLVELHGGTVGVHSVVGEGSTFSFTVPRRSPATQVTTQQFSGKVLVVDDDSDARAMMERFLKNEGYSTTALAEPDETLSTLEKEPYDLLIVDIMMPKTSGLTLLKKVKEAARDGLPAVMVTSAYHMNRDLVESLGGVWLPKPWTEAQLIERVRQITGRNAGPSQSPKKEA